MTLVVPYQMGEILLLQYIVGMVNADNPVLHLYSNDITPSQSSLISDLTEVPGSTGYVAVTLLSHNWTTVQSGGVTTAVYSEQTFSFTTDATAYGYYITNGSNQLLWLERFSGAPYSIPADGGTISITTELSIT